jgi:hypothetical protein
MEDIRDAAQYDDPLRRLEGRCQEKPLKDLDEDGPWDTLDGASAYELGLEVPASQELQDYKKGCIELGTHQLDDRVVFVRVPTGVDESALFRVGSDGSGTAMISAMTRDQQGVWQPLPDATWLAGKGQEFVIGRNPQSDVVLAAPTVSARHVSIRADQGLLTIESPATHGIELVIAREKTPTIQAASDELLAQVIELPSAPPVAETNEGMVDDARDMVEDALSRATDAAAHVIGESGRSDALTLDRARQEFLKLLPQPERAVADLERLCAMADELEWTCDKLVHGARGEQYAYDNLATVGQFLQRADLSLGALIAGNVGIDHVLQEVNDYIHRAFLGSRSMAEQSAAYFDNHGAKQGGLLGGSGVELVDTFVQAAYNFERKRDKDVEEERDAKAFRHSTGHLQSALEELGRNKNVLPRIMNDARLTERLGELLSYVSDTAAVAHDPYQLLGRLRAVSRDLEEVSTRYRQTGRAATRAKNQANDLLSLIKTQ